MTKIGEENLPPKPPNAQTYNKQLDSSCSKFLYALDHYENNANLSERDHWKSVMDQQLQLIRSAVSELKKTGIHDQEGVVEKEYRNYISGKTPDGFSSLHHNVETLKDYAEPEKPKM